MTDPIQVKKIVHKFKYVMTHTVASSPLLHKRPISTNEIMYINGERRVRLILLLIFPLQEI